MTSRLTVYLSECEPGKAAALFQELTELIRQKLTDVSGCIRTEVCGCEPLTRQNESASSDQG